jgi:ADP-heptose:LPS heptosyltransferase/predicted SAM-dependent methyltransferase
MTWRIDGPQGNESAKIKWEIVPYTRGTGLDLGCGPWKAFPHFTGVDNCHHAREFGWTTNPDIHVETCEDLSRFAGNSHDFVFSSHLLEHIENYQAALREWMRVIRPKGYLVLYVPDEDEYPKVGEPGANPDHKWNVNYDKVVEAMKGVGSWDLVDFQKRNGGDEYSLLFVFQKIGSKQTFSWKNPKPTKTAAVCRYGGIGDMIQCSSVLPGLKKQGYHVTLYTSDVGEAILRNDPNVDEWVVQDKDQVPNNQLGPFWEYLEKKYDKFINLSESVEGALLAIPGRTNHSWSYEARHKNFNKNYLELTHEIAGVPYDFGQKFYPTEEEKAWARKEKKAMGGYVIMWSLAGSSVHKSWPHLDAVIARLMIQRPDTRIVLCGDEICKLLERGWENEPRVICKSGVWGIRAALTFAQQADLVVGTETGLLNAVGLEEVPKVITLSHSSVENLTKHWKNTTSLEPRGMNCYPCHRLHYGFKYCFQDKETGCATCQVSITADDMYDAILNWMDKNMKEAA